MVNATWNLARFEIFFSHALHTSTYLQVDIDGFTFGKCARKRCCTLTFDDSLANQEITGTAVPNGDPFENVE